MIKIEQVQVSGWEAAIRGMRNPMNSWDKSDSYWGIREDESPINPCDEVWFFVGENDLKLMQTLSKAGNDHGKFLRMINVTMDITAPLYWWKEYDTYKVGTVANSCSTMHKIHTKEFVLDDFSFEHLSPDGMEVMKSLLGELNFARIAFLESNDRDYWDEMIQLLPTSYNQKRTVQLNYQVLKNMYLARKDHKLYEWREFSNMIETLPYAQEIICCE